MPNHDHITDQPADLRTSWSLQFDRDGTEDIAIICDAAGEETVRSRHFWLPEVNDPVPATLEAVRLMSLAPELLHHLRYFLGVAIQMDDGKDKTLTDRIEAARKLLSRTVWATQTRYFVTAWCNRPFFARCQVDAANPEEALANARQAIQGAPAAACDDDFPWDEWRVYTAESDAVLMHRDAAEHTPASPEEKQP